MCCPPFPLRSSLGVVPQGFPQSFSLLLGGGVFIEGKEVLEILGLRPPDRGLIARRAL